MSNTRQASKRGLTLDLNASPARKTRASVAAAAAASAASGNPSVPVLTTPDVQMLKLSSPELAKFLTSGGNGHGLATPTPSGYIFPKNVTEEQELYAKGFEEALKTMQQQQKADTKTAITTIEKATAAHNSRSAAAAATAASTSSSSSVPSAVAEIRPNSRPSSGASGSVDSDSYILPEGVRVKQEADDEDGSSKVVSPINMESQERIKLERKRLRNRVAASKCRKRKLERISQLDDKVKQLKGENSELAGVVKRLKAAVCDLKQEVMEHVNSGCQISLAPAVADAAGY